MHQKVLEVNRRVAAYKAIKAAEVGLANLGPLAPPLPKGPKQSLDYWPDKPWPDHFVRLCDDESPPPAPSEVAKGKRKADDQDHPDDTPPLRSSSPSIEGYANGKLLAGSEPDSDDGDLQSALVGEAHAQKRAKLDRSEVLLLSSDDDDPVLNDNNSDDDCGDYDDDDDEPIVRPPQASTSRSLLRIRVESDEDEDHTRFTRRNSGSLAPTSSPPLSTSNRNKPAKLHFGSDFDMSDN